LRAFAAYGTTLDFAACQAQTDCRVAEETPDVILPGVAIYEAVMEQFGFNELRVSTRGLRFAAAMDGT